MFPSGPGDAPPNRPPRWRRVRAGPVSECERVCRALTAMKMNPRFAPRARAEEIAAAARPIRRQARLAARRRSVFDPRRSHSRWRGARRTACRRSSTHGSSKARDRAVEASVSRAAPSSASLRGEIHPPRAAATLSKPATGRRGRPTRRRVRRRRRRERRGRDGCAQA